MANRFAIANGNFNATSTWSDTAGGSGGFSVPVLGDNAYANNKTVTITASATCDKVSVEAENGATAGGGFTLNSGVTLTANVVAGGTASNQCVSYSAATPAISYVVGNVSGSTTGVNTHGIAHSGTGRLDVTGNVTAYAGSGITVTASGTLNVTGTVTGPSAGQRSGLEVTAGASNSVVNIVGNVTGGPLNNASSQGVGQSSNGTINITGNVTGGTLALQSGISMGGNGTVNVTGNVTGGSANQCYGARIAGTGTLNITGSCIGGTGTSAHGVSNESTGTARCTRAVGSAWGPGSSGTNATYGMVSTAQGSLSYVQEIEFGALGMAPTSGSIILTDVTSNVALFYRPSLSKKTLIDAISVAGALPAASNVRYGVSYNQGNTTGTCYVPAAGSVALGINVDNTVGTAVLTQSAVWGALTSGMVTSGSVGERLSSASTVTTTGAQLAAALTS